MGGFFPKTIRFLETMGSFSTEPGLVGRVTGNPFGSTPNPGFQSPPGFPYIFCRESQPKPLFATSQQGGGEIPTCLQEEEIRAAMEQESGEAVPCLFETFFQ